MSNYNIRILLVDDEPDILEFIGYNLKNEGYQVFTANNGKKAVEKALEIKPHLILLDVMMPVMDGIETCLELKSREDFNDTLIVFLSARGEDYSQIMGLESGADDYITKPIRPKVLKSKVKSLFRRISESEVQTDDNRIELKDMLIDRERYQVIYKEEKVLLPRKEFEILFLLASRCNKVVRREEIYTHLWGNKIIVGDRTIDVHIRRLRKSMEIENIKTVKGIGYMYEE
ncbi:MAG: response regulator transcription factor [Bacteroidales bacterium]|jgi:two-component system alkaline phosphatase synthesis response regulator PhoP|nr:response regulator transcription factor [Bacteroidales bacterium]